MTKNLLEVWSKVETDSRLSVKGRHTLPFVKGLPYKRKPQSDDAYVYKDR